MDNKEFVKFPYQVGDIVFVYPHEFSTDKIAMTVVSYNPIIGVYMLENKRSQFTVMANLITIMNMKKERYHDRKN